ncbi:MAG: 3-keto-5-aminohexanoate cleavage protein [Chloroflexi bacterium]|nr:3-keto-5-aminohexanoate cleavage protein [Chloroflexota bacterium]
MDKMMIEVALNELATKDQNSHVPYGPEEVIKDAVACAKAGAQIIHFHARDKSGEQLWQSAETYAEAMREIKKQCDAILYPTYPGGMPGSQRIAHVVKLADNPDVRLELATLDLGATNGGRIDPVLGGFKNGGGAYVNSHNDVVDMMRALRRHSVHYSLGVRDVGHMRHIHAYAQLGLVKSPWAVKIFMSAADPHGPFPDVRGIMMYLDMVPNDVQCHWFLTTYNASEVHERLNSRVGDDAMTIGSTAAFASEAALEAHIRDVVLAPILKRHPDILCLKNKDVVDVIICRDGSIPKAFFLEIKLFQPAFGRLGIGSAKGAGLQPEIIDRDPLYFQNNLRWLLAHQAQPGFLLLSTSGLKPFITGGGIGAKFNNINTSVFRQKELLSETQLESALESWLLS